MLLGVDTGGTFTDFVLWQDGRLRLHKCLSTPAAPEQAILQGIRDLGLVPEHLRMIHGSTVATNAVLEGKGVRTAYVTNQGMGDLLSIGRQAREELYALEPSVPPRPVPRALCLELPVRRAANGDIIEPLSEDALTAVRASLSALAPQAVAINLLFSYLDSEDEARIAAAVPEGIFVSRSSEILPLQGEYERGIATWLNAWVGPILAGYLKRLQQGLPGAQIRVMQSSGEALAAEQSARTAVRLLLSGPAGGLVGARAVGEQAGLHQLLSFDMGGTSTDVALIDGAPRLTTQGRIGSYPVALPMVDMHTIGAGGGSIARLDAGGLLLVGPESAGADPGPICYGKGGTQVTVTDANLVLGRLRPEAFLGGRMRLDTDAARAGLARLGQAMGMSAENAALGVIAIANEHMAGALRVISVQRGIDPKGFTLCSFGGAGGLHVCALAEALEMDTALVPAHAGVLSALGMLVAPPGRVLTRAWLQQLDACDSDDILKALDDLARQASAELVSEGIEQAELTTERSVDLRYLGQSATLNLQWLGRSKTEQAFARLHQQRYGHLLERPVEIVNLRVRLTAPPAQIALGLDGHEQRDGEVSAGVDAPAEIGPAESAAYGADKAARVLQRAAMKRQETVTGPAIVLDPVSTTWIAPGWQARLDDAANLRLSRAWAALGG
ncbi:MULTISPECIES: hydantoinase/oxoprolinase family protein [Thiorhodovibrio]|uniref:hydantoinase/oxoprolinase family protein n=1 Tax=Thiorhodovibrio TaxID=61593 RepID=UPI001912BD51|nr:MULTISPECIES: hydantoinase/oxoprolinase family protein [Thiorhodovibrio]MBK5969071.1 hydantoinase [Thiorhodovibrio winogradskyi]WPL14724.1 Acetophenone carboxylase gamma subunit [Thiorhodovibrio litoralis]